MNHLNNKCIFGIRKIHGVTGSVMLGLSLLASPVFADGVNVEAESVNDKTVLSDQPVLSSGKSIDDNKSVVETKPDEKQLNRMNNYNPKWDHVDEKGNIIRDLNEYSDPNFTKGHESLFDSEGNRVENDTQSSEKKPDSDTVIETSKPVDESKFEFKTSWEDNSAEDKSGIYNSQSNSLIGTYSGT